MPLHSQSSRALDGPQVATCKAKLHSYAVAMAAGLAIRTLLADDELTDSFIWQLQACAFSIFSAAEYLHRHQMPGYLLSFDFFHDYDSVSLPWVDKVMEDMGFEAIFRGWAATLYQHVSAAFLLHNITPFITILFSIRKGSPLATLLVIIYLEPFLVRLEASLHGLQVAQKVSFGSMGDVEILGSDSIMLAFEAAGVLLYMNRKTLLLGLGSWVALASGCNFHQRHWL
jgi:hypothetical protein